VGCPSPRHPTGATGRDPPVPGRVASVGPAIPAVSNTEPTPQRVAAIREQLSHLEAYLEPDALAARLAELEERMGAPGFWDDQEGAAQVSAEHARTARKLETFRALHGDVADLADLAELAEEDPDLAGELDAQLAGVEERLEALEEERLFSGPYDAGDALVTVNAGAGGTDAQDWAEMVLRMLMRWAERRGFRVELLEASPGEEAGIKSATFRASGDNAYGLFSAEKGVHRLVRLSPFDSANRRQTSFAGVEVAPVIEEGGDVEIDEDDLQIDTYRASGAGGQHVNKTDSAVRITHRPTGIVVQCQNERSQSANKQTAMNMLRSRLVELEERRRREEIAREKGEAQDVNFGSQIRSYVLHPYTMVKDHRTNHEMGDAQRVLDGDLDGFVRAELLRSAGR
jgi:peptide chain release factor 2